MYPRKCFVRDLIRSSETSVWISGKIEAIGPGTLMLDDGTGKARVVDCVPAFKRGILDSPSEGCRCSVIGILVRNDSPPEIRAEKIIAFEDNRALRDLWTNEVQELQMFLDGKLEPSLAI